MILQKLNNYLIGEFDVIPYNDIVILCNKVRKSLKPNIYVNAKFLRIGETIRGNIIIACKEKESFKSLTKEQCIKYINFLKYASFNYNKCSNKDNLYNFQNNHISHNLERDFSLSDYGSNKNTNNDEILQMILAIQRIILKFIKNNKKEG